MTSVAASTSLSPGQLQRIRTQAEELEGVFLTMLTKTMFEGIKPDENFGGGFGEETWRSMQAEQLGAAMAQGGGIGIAEQIMGDMIALQEAANAAQPAFTAGNLMSKGVYQK